MNRSLFSRKQGTISCMRTIQIRSVEIFILDLYNVWIFKDLAILKQSTYYFVFHRIITHDVKYVSMSLLSHK